MPPPQDPLGVLDRRGTRIRVQNTWPGTQQKKNKKKHHTTLLTKHNRTSCPLFKFEGKNSKVWEPLQVSCKQERKKGHKGAKLHNKRLVVELHIITQIIHSLVPKGSQPPGDLVGGNRL